VGGNSPTTPGAWLEMMQTLKENGVTLINPHEVPICQEKGIPVLDVRTIKQYEEVMLASHCCVKPWCSASTCNAISPMNVIMLHHGKHLDTVVFTEAAESLNFSSGHNGLTGCDLLSHRMLPCRDSFKAP
jgi:hypothetical protein